MSILLWQKIYNKIRTTSFHLKDRFKNCSLQKFISSTNWLVFSITISSMMHKIDVLGFETPNNVHGNARTFTLLKNYFQIKISSSITMCIFLTTWGFLYVFQFKYFYFDNQNLQKKKFLNYYC